MRCNVSLITEGRGSSPYLQPCDKPACSTNAQYLYFFVSVTNGLCDRGFPGSNRVCWAGQLTRLQSIRPPSPPLRASLPSSLPWFHGVVHAAFFSKNKKHQPITPAVPAASSASSRDYIEFVPGLLVVLWSWLRPVPSYRGCLVPPHLSGNAMFWLRVGQPPFSCRTGLKRE